MPKTGRVWLVCVEVLQHCTQARAADLPQGFLQGRVLHLAAAYDSMLIVGRPLPAQALAALLRGCEAKAWHHIP